MSQMIFILLLMILALFVGIACFLFATLCSFFFWPHPIAICVTVVLTLIGFVCFYYAFLYWGDYQKEHSGTAENSYEGEAVRR